MEKFYSFSLPPHLKSIERRAEDMKRRTTVGCGGVREVFYPSSEDELMLLIRFFRCYGLPYAYIGAGSNSLIADGFSEFLYISLKKLRGVAYKGDCVSAYSGEPVSSLILKSCANGYSFAEFMTGIPAFVGGAVFMNAGVSLRHISDVVKTVYATDGSEIIPFSAGECAFGLKNSVFQRNGLCVVKAEFYAEREEKDKILSNIRFFKSLRLKLPQGKSMGCVFKNGKIPSGKLIEKCGLKNFKIGGAYVSGEHANIIINSGGATYRDILSLVSYIQSAVYIKRGVKLEREIRILP